MARVVTPTRGPGSYGLLGHGHPDLKDYVWVQWVDVGFEPTTWSGGRPAEGYYARSQLREIGTVFL